MRGLLIAACLVFAALVCVPSVAQAQCPGGQCSTQRPAKRAVARAAAPRVLRFFRR